MNVNKIQTKPQYLSTGQKIGIMAPSSYVDRTDIENSAKTLETLGYEVFVHPQTFERNGQSAGNTLQKSLAFQGLWIRKDIDAIWFAGGGNQSLDLIKTLNFEKLTTHIPKPIIGFSDNTTLLNAVPYYTDATAFHAPVFKQIHKLSPENLAICLDTLSGKNKNITFNQDQILTSANKEKTTGIIIGGNLSIFQYMVGLLPSDFLQNKIICLEDCNEELSRIDRSLSFLKSYGAFEKASAVIIGDFSNTQDTGRPFEQNLNSIINNHTADANIPVITGFKFGHTTPYYSLVLGKKSTIDFKKTTITTC